MIIILLGAAILDYLLGDPWHWLHPVQVMGWVIGGYGDRALKLFKGEMPRRIAGVGLLLVMMIGTGGISWGMIYLAGRLHPVAGTIVSIILLASCMAGRSLRDAAIDVLTPLKAGDLGQARTKLSQYVGRDTADLDEAEILRAVTETVAENAVDGVMGPLFWAIVGAFMPVGPVVLAMVYKAVSTLDSMVGYKTEDYRYLGAASAHMDDVLTWLPCRLTVLCLAIFSGKPRQVLAICRRDGPKDPSPNSGWSEAAYAAVLGVQLGGINTYGGVVREKPVLGAGGRSLSAEVVYEALRWNRWLFLGWLVGAMVGWDLITDCTIAIFRQRV